jgi:mannosyltransferase OCH1-like enzyme
MQNNIQSVDIPKIIHFIWIQDKTKIPDKHQKIIENWKFHNPDWNIMIWDKKNILELISDIPNVDCEVLHQIFNKLSMIESVDFSKYILMYIYGGLYVDMDINCCSSINKLVNKHLISRNKKIGIVSSRHPGNLVFAGLFFSVPKHGFWITVLRFIIKSSSKTCISLLPLIYKVPHTTGSNILHESLMKYNNDDIHLFPSYLLFNEIRNKDNCFYLSSHESSWSGKVYFYFLRFIRFITPVYNFNRNYAPALKNSFSHKFLASLFPSLYNQENSYNPEKYKHVNNKEIPKRLLIVAHPDDEILWFGDHLREEKNWKVICITNGDNVERRKEFLNVAEYLEMNAEIWSYEDHSWKGTWNKNLHLDIENIIKSQNWEFIFTHNEFGEYGHKQHQDLHYLVKDICLKNKKTNLYQFAFSANYSSEISLNKKYIFDNFYKSQKISYFNHKNMSMRETIPLKVF